MGHQFPKSGQMQCNFIFLDLYSRDTDALRVFNKVRGGEKACSRTCCARHGVNEGTRRALAVSAGYVDNLGVSWREGKVLPQ